MLTRPMKTSDPVTAGLQALVQKAPELEEAAEVYRVIIPLLGASAPLALPIAMTPAEARIKLQKEQPLLDGEELVFDEWVARDLLIQLARGLETVRRQSEAATHLVWMKADRRKKPRNQGPLDENDGELLRATSARQIRILLERGRLEVGTILSRVAAGDHSFLFAMADDLHLDAGLLWTLGRYALMPALYAWRTQLAPMANGAGWEKEFCFICGSDAAFGELRGDDQTKHLRCVRCGADWSVRRLRCVYCGNEDHKTLSYLYPEGQRDQFRVEVCNNCSRHLKVITSYDPISPEMLIVQDLSTIHLDMIAMQKGYK